MAWGVNSPQYLTLTEVHDHFISYFLHTSAKFAKVNKSKNKASTEAVGMVLCVRPFVRSKLGAIFKLSSDWDWDLGPGTWDLGRT